MLLLGPSDRGVFVLLEDVLDFSFGEWSELLASHNSHIVSLGALSRGLQVEVHLTGTQNDLLDLVVGYETGVLIWNNLLETMVFIKFFNGRAGSCILQEFLWGRNDQRLPVRSSHLLSQKMEEVCSGRWVANVHVDGSIDFIRGNL